MPNIVQGITPVVQISDTVIIKWSPSMNVYGPETYVVNYGIIDLNFMSDEVMDNFVQLTNLEMNTVYYYYVTAINSVGTSRSSVYNFTTPPGMFTTLYSIILLQLM